VTDPRIRVAIVGCGVIGRHHAAVLTAHPRFVVAALVDTSPTAAHDVARLNSANDSGALPVVGGTLQGVLGLDPAGIDLVVVCTPSGTHIDIATEAVTAGLHTVVEKPLDVDIAKGRRFVALAADAAARGVHVSVISQHRFDPASLAVRSAASDGRLGRVTSAVASVAWWRDQAYYDAGRWRGTWALDGGGAVMNQGVHTVDLLCWFLGRPIEVHAHTALLAHEGLEVEDTAVATVRFESGALAVVHATTAAYPGLTVRVQVHGSAGSAIIDNDRLEYFHSAQTSGPGNPGTGAGGITGGDVTGNEAEAEVGFDETTAAPRRDDAFAIGHRRQYDSIAHSIDTGSPPAVTVDDAFLAIAVVRGFYLSSTLGRSVSIGDVLAGRYDSTPVRTGSAQTSVPR
jgi:UDP-N-acetyl-2-amino-2-deoxyglucuronate dehydrogenase